MTVQTRMLQKFLMLIECILTLAKLSASKTSPENRLRVELREGYDISTRPVLNPETPVNVSFKTIIYQLVDLKTKDQTIEMLMFQRLEWTDEFLQWNPRNFQGLEWLRFYRSHIWTPDILPFNDVGSFDLEKYDHSIPITVYYTGEVVWARPVNYKTTCSLDVTSFPFDTQTCEIVVGSWQYFKGEINLTCSPVDLSQYMQDSLWTLKGECNVFVEQIQERVYHIIFFAMHNGAFKKI